MIDFDTFSFMAENLLSHSWIYAKTMPEHPHWYTLRKQWDNDSDFVEVARLIREHGYKEKFFKTWFTRFDLNGMKYWTMGAPLDITILINRAHIERPSPYDAIARQYDSLFSDPVSLAENEQVIAMLPGASNVLDIGCGPGLFLNYRQPQQYTGLDASREMLKVLAEKHPGHNTVATPFENFYGRDYDLIIALFGSASYINPETLHRIPKMLSPGGEYFLMFYAPDYYPVTYQKTGIEVEHYTGGYDYPLGEQTAFNNFVIVQGKAEPDRRKFYQRVGARRGGP